MIRYCNRCACVVQHAIPDGDHLPRAICSSCGHIQYENPHLIVGCIAEWQGKILLCRRAIEPGLGYWTLPAGFMENGETTAGAAVRETFEEAGAQVDSCSPFFLANLSKINQVHLFFRAVMTSERTLAGIESIEVALFDESAIPWNSIAFTSVRRCLERYLADRKRSIFGFHTVDIEVTFPTSAAPAQ